MTDFTLFPEVVRRLDASGVPWGVFAGAAVQIYGGTRPLTDIDILIPSDAGKRVAAVLPEARYTLRDDGAVADLHFGAVEVIAGLTRALVFEMDEEMIVHLRRGNLLGVEVSVLSVEDNLAIKAILGRGPEVGKHDWEDINTLLSLQTPDWAYLHWRLSRSDSARADDLFGKLRRIVKTA